MDRPTQPCAGDEAVSSELDQALALPPRCDLFVGDLCQLRSGTHDEAAPVSNAFRDLSIACFTKQRFQGANTVRRGGDFA